MNKVILTLQDSEPSQRIFTKTDSRFYVRSTTPHAKCGFEYPKLSIRIRPDHTHCGLSEYECAVLGVVFNLFISFD